MKKILIVAGEASGDMHAAELMKSLISLQPDSFFAGVGGDRMVSQGLEQLYHIKDFAFLGLVEVVKHIPFMRKVRKNILDYAINNKIELAILVDYPGFNLSLAEKLKKNGIKIIYYISPQIWAWGKERIKKIKKIVDKMIVIFPFEEKMYKDYGIDVSYVGHPIVDRLNNFLPKKIENFYGELGIPEDSKILIVMPGSRKQEVQKILPLVIEAVLKIKKDFNLYPVIVESGNIEEEFYNQFRTEGILMYRGDTYDILRNSYVGIIKSGTSTLEASVFGVPFVVVYKTGSLTYFIGKQLVKIGFLAMANIIAGKKIVDELIQNNLTTENLVKSVSELVLNPERFSEVKKQLSSVKDKLGDGGASQKAAEIIINIL